MRRAASSMVDSPTTSNQLKTLGEKFAQNPLGFRFEFLRELYRESNQMVTKILKTMRAGQVFTRADFNNLGSRASVNRALKQLVDAGTIRRISRGLYDLPRYNKLLGGYAPVQTDQVLQAIQRRDSIRIMPDGFTAANNLGFTIAVPAKISFYTDGSSRKIIIGSSVIVLNHAGSTLMFWHSRSGRDVVLALKWLGRQNVDDFVVGRIRELPREVREDLLDGLDHMPRWMGKILKRPHEGGRPAGRSC